MKRLVATEEETGKMREKENTKQVRKSLGEWEFLLTPNLNRRKDDEIDRRFK